MPRCIYNLTNFDSANGEHVLQNFLGARWKSKTIVCDELQDEFSHSIDAALENGLRQIRNLLGTRGGRGEPGPTLEKLRATGGEVYDIEPGFRARLREPIVRFIELPDGRKGVELLLGNVKRQLGWGLALIRKDVPNLLVDEAALRTSVRTVPLPSTRVWLGIRLGGRDYFRGMLKSCFNLLAASHPALPYESCFDAVRDFIRTGKGSPGQFIRWMSVPDHLNVPALGPADQAIFIVSRGSSVEGVVQFFGHIVHPFQLTAAYAGEPVRCAYVVDPFRKALPAEIRQPDFAEEAIPVYAGQSREATSDVMAALRERMSRISEVCREQWFERILAGTIREVLGGHVGESFTPELASQLAARLTDRMAALIFLS